MGDQPADSGHGILRAAGRSAGFLKGHCLITMGAISDEVLLVEAGLVKVVLLGDDGVETVTNLLGRGALLGENGVLNDQPRSAEVRALLNGWAVHVAAKTFRRLFDGNAAVRGLVYQNWLDRQRDADHHQLGQAHDVTTRVGMALLRWARTIGTPTPSGLRVRGVSQKVVAQAVAASEGGVEAALATLRESGLLVTGRLAYVITEPDALERLLARRRRGPNDP